MKLLRSIKKNWFSVTVLFLSLVFVVNLLGGFTKLHLFWKNKIDKSPVTEVEKWQTWLTKNSELFSALSNGAQIGITKNLKSDYGVILTKQRNSIEVQRTNELRKIGPGIILEFNDQVAKDLQWKKNKDEAIIFLSHRSRIGKIQTYYLKKEKRLRSEGFVTFLQEIGLRPAPASKKSL